MKETKKYTFSGAVKKYGVLICPRWEAATMAETEAKARSNLKYRFKKQFGMIPQVPIELVGTIEIG